MTAKEMRAMIDGPRYGAAHFWVCGVCILRTIGKDFAEFTLGGIDRACAACGERKLAMHLHCLSPGDFARVVVGLYGATA